jgi:glycosyltransferase involved in cell wall biosynthesis
MRLAVDATNLRAGGGVTHLANLLRAAVPEEHGIDGVAVWGPRSTLERLPVRDWLDLHTHSELDRGGLSRFGFQQLTLPRQLQQSGVDALFVPGGVYLGRFRPFVTMFRNMLPFAPREAARYGMSPVGVRLRMLRQLQAATFRRADGVVCLSEYAASVLASSGVAVKRQAVIPHGVDEAFRHSPRAGAIAANGASTRPLRLLYVSIVDLYKHQWTVAEAVLRLHRRGVAISLDLVGPAYPPAMRRLAAVTSRLDPSHEIVRYLGEVPASELPAIYAGADAFVFASTCENMPNILLEAMASGLPIASSDRRPMPDFLGDAGVYFDPENVDSIERALEALTSDPVRRAALAAAASQASARYSWSRCAGDTLAFIRTASSS